MFAYCNNNPIRYVDKTGMFLWPAAQEMLSTWLNGDGSAQFYGEKSKLVKALKKSTIMNEIITSAINNCRKTGTNSFSDSVKFTSSDSMDLYLSIRRCEYTITIKEEYRTIGFWMWKIHQKRYVATIVLSDFYNFDGIEPWDSFGRICNNGAFILHNVFAVGMDYKWTAKYTYTTVWENYL